MKNNRLALLIFTLAVMLFFPVLILGRQASVAQNYTSDSFLKNYSYNVAKITPLDASEPQLAFHFATIKFSEDIPYFYAGSVIASEVSSEGMAIATHDGQLIALNNELSAVLETSSSGQARQIAYHNSTLISLISDKIIFNTATASRELSGSYQSFMLDRQNNSLIAFNGLQLYFFELDALLNSVAPVIDEMQHTQKVFGIPESLKSKQFNAFTVINDYLYISTQSTSNIYFDDLFCIDTLTGNYVMYQADGGISSLVASTDNLFVLARGNVTKYSIFEGRLSKLASKDFSATSVSLYNDTLYMTTQENAMISTTLELNDFSYIFASQSSADGFFSSPTSSYTRRGRLYVTDTQNSRLLVAEGSDIRYVDDLEGITSVVSDNIKNIYVAHGINRITQLNNDLEVIKTFSLPKAVSRLVVDINNNVFALTPATNEVFRLEFSDSVTMHKVLDNCVDLEFTLGNSTLIHYDGDNVYKTNNILDPQSQSVALFSKTDIVSFAADFEGNVFFFDKNGDFFKYDALEEQVISFPYLDSLKQVTSVYIANVENDFVSIGDLVFTDNVRHCVYKLAKELSGVVTHDSSYVSPDFSEKTAIDTTKPIIYRLKADAELFPSPVESGSNAFIVAGERIIYVEEYNKLEEFAFVILENVTAKTLTSGYVFRSLIDFSSYSFSTPPASSAAVFIDNTPIFKLPSLYSPSLKELKTGDSITLYDFSAPIGGGQDYSLGSYVDSLDNIWYRTQLSETEYGYILASHISINQYNPQIRPKANAEIKAHDGNTFATLYSYDANTGIYKELETELPLAAGTRVELVKTPLNPQNEYTEIRFYREDLGTLTCYVKTVHVEYDTINTLQIVAIIALVVLTILTVILVIYFVAHKRSRRI